MTLLCAQSGADLSEINHGTHKTLIDNHGNLCFIDVDWKEPIISGAPLILSYHNFEETPTDLEAILSLMQAREATLYKIATMAHSTLDALRMLEFVRSHPNVIGICMGPLGQITRILAPVFGTPIMYASIESTPNPVEPVAKPQFWPDPALFGQDSDSSPTTYFQSSMSICEETRPAQKSSGLGSKASFATDSLGQVPLQTLLNTYHFRTLHPKTPLFGLIGDPVDVSIGHIFHNTAVPKAVYVKMAVKPSELGLFLAYAKKLNFRGLSVTMPLKESVIPYLDAIDPEAERMGAVNTLLFQDGKIKGFNTDGKGALAALGEVRASCKTPFGRKSALFQPDSDFTANCLSLLGYVNLRPNRTGRKITEFASRSECYNWLIGKKIVIIGAGGASKAIAYALRSARAVVTVANRTPKEGVVPLHQIPEDYDILINATPNPMPIDASKIIPGSTVMDICINERTYLGNHFEEIPEEFSDRFFDAERRQCEEHMAERGSEKDIENSRKIRGRISGMGSKTLLQESLAKGCVCVSGYPLYLHQAMEQQRIWELKLGS